MSDRKPCSDEWRAVGNEQPIPCSGVCVCSCDTDLPFPCECHARYLFCAGPDQTPERYRFQESFNRGFHLAPGESAEDYLARRDAILNSEQ